MPRFLIFCAVLLTLACVSQEERLARHKERAETYYANEEWAEAKIEFLNLLQLDPSGRRSFMV